MLCFTYPLSLNSLTLKPNAVAFCMQHQEGYSNDSPVHAQGQHHARQQWLQSQPSPESDHLATPVASQTNQSEHSAMHDIAVVLQPSVPHPMPGGCILQGDDFEPGYHWV